MIHFGHGEDKELKYGINFYSLNDRASMGFVIKITNKLAIRCRKSKITGKFHFQVVNLYKRKNEWILRFL